MTDHDKQPPEQPPDRPEPEIDQSKLKEEAIKKWKMAMLAHEEEIKNDPEKGIDYCKIYRSEGPSCKSPSTHFSWWGLIRLIAIPFILASLLFLLVAILWL